MESIPTACRFTLHITEADIGTRVTGIRLKPANLLKTIVGPNLYFGSYLEKRVGSPSLARSSQRTTLAIFQDRPSASKPPVTVHVDKAVALPGPMRWDVGPTTGRRDFPTTGGPLVASIGIVHPESANPDRFLRWPTRNYLRWNRRRWWRLSHDVSSPGLSFRGVNVALAEISFIANRAAYEGPGDGSDERARSAVVASAIVADDGATEGA